MQSITGPVEEQTKKLIGNSKNDDLRNASFTDKEKKKKDIQEKVRGASTGKKTTDMDLLKLNDPEGFLDRFKDRQILTANEGAMPKIKVASPSDYFKNEMMKQWLFAEGSTGDKDGQETNQAFKGIHIDSYPELAEEIRQGTLTDEKVAEIMYRQYTGQNVSDDKPSKFRDLSQLENVNLEAAKLLFMDAGYTGQNAGAIKDLQKYLVSKNKEIEVDGLLGEKTLAVMNDFDAEEYRKYLGTLDRYSGEKGSKVYNRFFTEEERQQLGLYEKELNAMAKGGSIDIQKFMEGGLAEDNDDTPGATKSEVADDIPAMISEGELVVPANVVRYHGLSKYENMRKTALKALDELEDNGQIRPVDENGTPIDKDIKEQTDKVMASKGATVARYNEGGSPAVVSDPIDDEIGKPVDPFGPRVTSREGQTITPDDSGNKATLTTPEGRNYRVTDPDTKITATGPRTTKVIGSDDVGGVDFDGVQFGKKRTPVTVSGPSTEEKLLSTITTVAALDQLFNGGKITAAVYGWAKTNMFDPIGNFLGFNKTAAANAGIIPSVSTSAAGITTIPTGSSVIGLNGKYYVSGGLGNPGIEVSANAVDMNTMTLKSDISFTGAGPNVSTTTSPLTGKIDVKPGYYSEAGFVPPEYIVDGKSFSTMAEAEAAAAKSGSNVVTSQDGLFSWKGGLATIGTALSLYDLVENGPSVTNVAGLGAGVGGMINAGVFGLSKTAGFGATGLGGALSTYATPLAFVALAAGLVEAFSGPPSQKVGEAAYDFDNPNYDPNDILSGGFWTKKRSDENIDAAKSLVTSVGSYVSSMEQALEINIGGELFIDVGNREGIRYSYVDGYDELGMYKYHKKDLDYVTLQAQKGFTGENAVTNLMDAIQDDTNVVVMFALADKAAGGEGYATYDNVSLYRKKINTLKTYRPGMAGSGTKAVLTDQERNLLDGFQKKEFAEVTGQELAALMPIYDKIAPVQQQNSFNLNSLGM